MLCGFPLLIGIFGLHRLYVGKTATGVMLLSISILFFFSLFFAMLVGDSYVDPTEWWDAKWVEEKVKSRLGGAEPAATAATQ